jgi:hypothetical protein
MLYSATAKLISDPGHTQYSLKTFGKIRANLLRGTSFVIAGGRHSKNRKLAAPAESGNVQGAVSLPVCDAGM